ncbi:MAG: hypothetical protein JO053_10375 [Acidobacteria bacterium]|nr:hypothetical protein [Acidobacteriota bacterium]
MSKLSAVGASLSFILVILALSITVPAQSRKAAANKKQVAAKKNDRKDKEKGRLTAKNAKDKKNSRDKKDDRASARDKKNQKNVADSRSKKDPKPSKAEARKAEEERRRKEAERRAAALEEARRREAVRREAIARKLAFERGLRTETIANISHDLTDGEDLNVRAAAINALGDKAGSVVVMEAQTGKVLTIVNQDWAVRSSIRPCSTVKLVTGVAALNEGVIGKETGAIKNTATRRLLDDAYAFSDNTYFQRAGMQVGTQKFADYGRKLGLGEPTGVNMPGEVSGRLPTTNTNPRIYSHGDDTEVSTIQLAVLASEITNGGHRVLPRIPRNSQDNARFQPFYKAEVGLPQQNVRRVIPGMMGAAEYGTAHRNMDQSLGVAGKTGSCIDKGSWVGLFASVAPIENPKYAVAVITRGQKERGKYAAAVAAQIYRALAKNIVRTDRNLAQTEFHIAPKNAAAIKAAAATGADEDDDADAADANADNVTAVPMPKNIIVVPSAPKNDSQKLINRTVDSKPVNQKPATVPAKTPAKPNTNNKNLFPPVVITYDKDGHPIP